MRTSTIGLLLLFAVTVAAPASAQDVNDVSKDMKSKLEAALKKASFEQSMMTHRDYTGKFGGWELKAKGKASISKINKLDTKLFRIDYPAIELPDGTKKAAYSDYSGNIQIDLDWKSESRGEKWGVALGGKTLIDVLWGKSKPTGKASLKIEVTKAGAKVELKVKDVKVEPNSDSRAGEFAKERLIEPKLKALALKTIKDFGIVAK